VEEVALAKGQFLGGAGLGSVVVERFDDLCAQSATGSVFVFVFFFFGELFECLCCFDFRRTEQEPWVRGIEV
jgi:hypothetical protein